MLMVQKGGRNMRFPKPARWALGILLVFVTLKGGCEIAEEILEHWGGHHDPSVPTSPNQRKVTSEIGRGSRAYAGEPGQKALSYLRDNAGRLGLKPSLDDVKIIDARANDFSTNVEFQQAFRGLAVENARVQVNFDKDGHVVQVVNSYTPPVNVSDQITIPKEQAESLARQEFSHTTPIYVSKVDEQERARGVFVDAKDIKLAEPLKTNEVYFSLKDQLRRAYKTYIHANSPFGIKEVVTDAGNGAVLQVRNFIYDAVDGRGQVFIPNPVNSLNDNRLRDSDNSGAAVPSASPTAYKLESLPELEAPSGGPFVLKGPYVVLEDIEPPKNTVPVNTVGPDFLFTRDSENFEDVMVYYHIDRMQRYIQTLGLKGIMNRQIRADAHGFDGGDNSRYVSTPTTLGQGYLAFGDGGVDDAEDADVIAHEYGHAIQDNQTLGKYAVVTDETSAMAEGFGDYWAFSMYKAESEASRFDLRCLMEWDHVPTGINDCFRRVGLNKTKVPGDFTVAGDAHINGLVWASTLSEIFIKLGKETADALILQSHFNVPTSPNFEQGADAILVAALQRNQEDKIPELCNVFQRHQIYKANHCPKVSLPVSGATP
jgi:Fungalysin metallopeptidase (M36)/Fungalysin/Thermolysin Propeptide Motif